MVLYTSHIIISMPQGHDLSIGVEGSGFQYIRQTGIDHPRMVPAHRYGLFQSLEQDFILNTAGDWGGNSMKHSVQVDEFASKDFGNGLLAKANAQNAFCGGIGLDYWFEQSRFIRDAGTG